MGFFARLLRRRPAGTTWGAFGPVGGFLGYYGLGDWWFTTFTTFTPAERDEIEGVWGYRVLGEYPLTRGQVASNPLTTAEFLVALATRSPNACIRQRILAQARAVNGGEMPGTINGRSYTATMERTRRLIEAGKLTEADPVVDTAFTAFEAGARIGPSLTEYAAVAPAPYYVFAVLYRKQKDYAREVAIFLERYLRKLHETGGASGRNIERLEKAKALLAGLAYHGERS